MSVVVLRFDQGVSGMLVGWDWECRGLLGTRGVRDGFRVGMADVLGGSGGTREC